jgi:hypothetical protein
VQIHALIRPFHIEINILRQIFWNYDVPVMEVPLMEDPVMEVPNMGTNNICRIFFKSQIFPFLINILQYSFSLGSFIFLNKTSMF